MARDNGDDPDRKTPITNHPGYMRTRTGPGSKLWERARQENAKIAKEHAEKEEAVFEMLRQGARQSQDELYKKNAPSTDDARKPDAPTQPAPKQDAPKQEDQKPDAPKQEAPKPAQPGKDDPAKAKEYEQSVMDILRAGARESARQLDAKADRAEKARTPLNAQYPPTEASKRAAGLRQEINKQYAPTQPPPQQTIKRDRSIA